MKFKAKMFDCHSVTRLQHVVAAVSKYCKSCALKLTREKLEFILNDKVVSSGISLWCEVWVKPRDVPEVWLVTCNLSKTH